MLLMGILDQAMRPRRTHRLLLLLVLLLLLLHRTQMVSVVMRVLAWMKMLLHVVASRTVVAIAATRH